MAEHIPPTQHEIDAHLQFSTAELLGNGVSELFKAQYDLYAATSSEVRIDELRSFHVAEAPITVVTVEMPRLGWDDTLAIGKVIGGKTALHLVDVVHVNSDGEPRISVGLPPDSDLSVDSPLVKAVLRVKEAQTKLGWRPESPFIED
jgi:hypothetical protein